MFRSVCYIKNSVWNEWQLWAPRVQTFGSNSAPGSVPETSSCLVSNQSVVLVTTVLGGWIEVGPSVSLTVFADEQNSPTINVRKTTTGDIFAARRWFWPESVRQTFPGFNAFQFKSNRTLVTDFFPDSVVFIENDGQLWFVRRSTIGRIVLTNPGKVVKVTGDIVPQPFPSSVENDAILLTIVIIWLIFRP